MLLITRIKTTSKSITPKKENGINNMVKCPYFNTNYLNLSKDFSQELSERDSFTIFVCVHGSGSISTENGEVTIQKGETVLIPALLCTNRHLHQWIRTFGSLCVKLHK